MEDKMDWYCAVWNSDEVSGVIAANNLYERLCIGDTSQVGDIEIIDEFYNDLEKIDVPMEKNKGKGFIIIGCDMDYAEFLNDAIQKLAKEHGLSFFEPQNMTYVF